MMYLPDSSTTTFPCNFQRRSPRHAWNPPPPPPPPRRPVRKKIKTLFGSILAVSLQTTTCWDYKMRLLSLTPPPPSLLLWNCFSVFLCIFFSFFSSLSRLLCTIRAKMLWYDMTGPLGVLNFATGRWAQLVLRSFIWDFQRGTLLQNRAVDFFPLTCSSIHDNPNRAKNKKSEKAKESNTKKSWHTALWHILHCLRCF